MSSSPADWRGRELGERTVGYDERDAVLYALAVGAPAGALDLVFEERLRVLPTFALTLAQWAPDALGSAGAFDVHRALHGSQRLQVLRPLPRSGELTMTGRVAQVWDKGSAAVFEVAVESDCFLATWSIFAPGQGGFGGERGPARPTQPESAPEWTEALETAANQAALYRLLGDRHHIHIDPEAAARIGQPRPILHGLATLAAATLVAAEVAGAHPADLSHLEGRFSAPVFPGESLTVRGFDGDRFDVVSGRGTVIDGGAARFG